MRRISDKGGGITKRELNVQAARMSKATGREFIIDYAYGGARFVKVEGGGHRELSPRLPKKALLAWIDAFASGYQEALEVIRDRAAVLAPLCPKCGAADVSKQGERPGSIGWTCAACGYLFETLTG